MNYGRIMGAVFGLAVATACAAQPKNNHVVEHEVAFDGCHFTMKDPYNGTLAATKRSTPVLANYDATINPNASHPFDTWIQFSCQNPVTSKTYLDLTSTRLTSHGWKLDTSKEDPNFPNPKTTLYVFHGKGWIGAGTTQDDTDGDEARRGRSFNFCIPHRKLALCGSVQSVGFLMWPKESTLPQIITLLESIEFIDPPSSASSATPTTPPPPTTSSAQ